MYDERRRRSAGQLGIIHPDKRNHPSSIQDKTMEVCVERNTAKRIDRYRDEDQYATRSHDKDTTDDWYEGR